MIQRYINTISPIINSKLFKYILFGLYLILTFILVINHEIWTDEAQAWEIARNLSIPEIINQMKYEGHPCLWHLMLAVPAKLGLPVITMNLISWVLVSITCYIILFYAKWNMLVKVAVILNPTFVYFLPVIARSYCLIPILLCLFSIYYPKRHKNPIIYTNILCLLAHTHIIMCGLVGIASFMFLIECIQRWKTLNKKTFVMVVIIFILYFLFLCIQIIPSFNECNIIESYQEVEKLKTVFVGFGEYFFPRRLVNEFPYVMAIIFLISVIFIFFYKKRLSLILCITLCIFTIIHLYWPFTMYERTCILFVIITILNFYNKDWKIQTLIFILAVSSLINKSYYIPFDIREPFSDSKGIADYINNNIEDNSLLIFLNSDRHVGVVPYIQSNKDIDYYNMKLQAYQTYITWIDLPWLEYGNTLEEIESFKSQYENIYILIATDSGTSPLDCEPIIDEFIKNDIVTLEYVTKQQNKLLLEYFSLYKFNTDIEMNHL